MKKLIFIFAFASPLFYSCNFSVGTNKDFSTGLAYSYNGFAIEKVLLVDPENKAMNNNEVKFGTQVAIVFQGLTNYQLKDDKAYPGLSLKVTDKEKKDVLNSDDLFASGEGYSAEDASVLRGTIAIGDPMKAGETYHVIIRAWDKNKPESELTAEVDLVVK
jgi:hypothetical protein